PDDLTPFLDAVKARKESDTYPEFQHCTYEMRGDEYPWLALTATTDADGRFRLQGFGRERMVIALIAGPGVATQDVRIMTPRTPAVQLPANKGMPGSAPRTYYGADFTHAAAPERPVVGVVRDKDTKQPLAGVRIQSYRLEDSWLHGHHLAEAVSDAQGRYR